MFKESKSIVYCFQAKENSSSKIKQAQSRSAPSSKNVARNGGSFKL